MMFRSVLSTSCATFLLAGSFLVGCGGAFSTGGSATGGSAGSGGSKTGGSGGGGPGGSCQWNGHTYANGESFPASDGCNTCSCNSGQVGCTLMACGQGCLYDGTWYAPGDTFTATDGCNQCSCDASGNVACTERACLSCTSITTAYSNALDQAKACDPQQVGQCSLLISGGLACGCSTFVNPANTDAIATLQATQQQYVDAACASGILCAPCEMPNLAQCSPDGQCVDVVGASCSVNGVQYPSGSTGIPGPLNCNTCSCNDGHLDCTTDPCPTQCPAGTVLGTQCAQCGPTDACEVVETACLPTCTDTCATGICLSGVCAQVCG